MTADDAAATWLTRVREIEEEYSQGVDAHRHPDPDRALVKAEASRARFGISNLLEVRDAEISDEMRQALYDASDRAGAVIAGAVDQGMGSPAAAALDSFTGDVKGFLERGVAGVKDFIVKSGNAVKDLPGDLSFGAKFAMAAAVVVLLLLYLPRKR